MDDILSQVEEKNLIIENILNVSNVLDSEAIEKIQLLYSEKRSLLNQFIDYRKSDSGESEFKSNPDYWSKRYKVYLDSDKKIMNKLASKVKLHADLIKDNSSKKKLLIYSRV